MSMHDADATPRQTSNDSARCESGTMLEGSTATSSDGGLATETDEGIVQVSPTSEIRDPTPAVRSAYACDEGPCQRGFSHVAHELDNNLGPAGGGRHPCGEVAASKAPATHLARGTAGSLGRPPEGSWRP